MARTTVDNIRGMNWTAKISRVLIFFMMLSAFMVQGLYKAQDALAAISQPTAWTQQYAAVAYPAGTVGANLNIAAGSGRLLVVAIASTATTSIAQTVSNVSWNGQALMLAAGDGAATTTPNHTYLYYLKDASMPAGTTAAAITVTITGGTGYYTYVYAAVYAGVNQTGNPYTDAQNYNSNQTATTAVGPFAAGLTVAAGDQAIEIANIARSAAGTTARTISTWSNATWPAPSTVAATYNTVSGPCVGLHINNRNTTTAATETSQHTASNAASYKSMTGMSIMAAPAAVAPTLTTPTAASILATTATLGATISSIGTAAVTDSGIVWNTSTGPTIANNKTATSPLITTATLFTTPVTLLPAGTKIFYRGYATNSIGTAYSPEGTFYTEPAAQASGVNFTNISKNGMTVNWTRGSGDGVIVLVRNASITADPADGTYTTYAANTVYGSGTQIGGASVVYKGTGSSVAITGLTQSTTYSVAVYEFAGTSDTAGVNLGTTYDVPAVASSQATASPCAAGIPTALTVGTETTSSVSLTWTSGANNDYFNVYRDGAKISTDGGVTSGSFTDSIVGPGAAYSYTVSGYSNSLGCESDQAAAVSAYTLPATPGTPMVVNGGAGTSLNVTLNADANTVATTSYAIRVNGGAYTNWFVQSNGTVAAGQAWQSKAAWGTKQVTGLSNGTTYTFDVVARNSNPTPDLSSYSPSASEVPLVRLLSTITTCNGCHGNPPVDGATRDAATGAIPGSHSGNTHSVTACTICHTDAGANIGHRNGMINVSAGVTYSKGQSFAQSNAALAGGTCSNVAGCHPSGSPSPAWGLSLACTECHNAIITTTNAKALDASVTTRRNIVAEMKNTWSHKRSSAGGVPASTVVTQWDCIVCHMEGDPATGSKTSKHGDGYIDLRDPDTGTQIKEVTGFSGTPGSYASGVNDMRFVRFSRNLGVTLENDPAWLTLAAIQMNQCLKCHDANGAASELAHVSTGSALQPFGVAITGQVVPYNTNGNGNVVNVSQSFATTNASYHPVAGKQNNSYVQGAQMIAPWALVKTNGNNTSYGALMSCWDCHATLASTGTMTSTVTAHGNAVTLRGPIRAAGTTAATNLCVNCHATKYSTTGTAHGAGSAFTSGSGNMGTATFNNCSYCHGYGVAGATYAAASVGRPLRAEEGHGFNDRIAGTVGSKWTSGARPYAFIRNTLSNWAPTSATGDTINNPHTCSGTAGTCNNNMNNSSFGLGGVY